MIDFGSIFGTPNDDSVESLQREAGPEAAVAADRVKVATMQAESFLRWIGADDVLQVVPK